MPKAGSRIPTALVAPPIYSLPSGVGWPELAQSPLPLTSFYFFFCFAFFPNFKLGKKIKRKQKKKQKG